jgi:hypothetical protein
MTELEPPLEDSSTLITPQPQDSPEIPETLAVASENMRCEENDGGGGGGSGGGSGGGNAPSHR